MLLRTAGTSHASLADALRHEQTGAQREGVIDLVFAHATGTPLSLVRSAEQLADLHDAMSRRLGAEPTAGVSHLADAFAALMRGSAAAYTRCASSAGRVFSGATARHRAAGPDPSAMHDLP